MVDSRVAGKGTIRRRRECLLCAQRFTTFERTEESPLFVVKRDGSRQPFDRGKLMAGLVRACTKRPLSLEQIEGAAATVEARLRNGIREEVPSQAIGDAGAGRAARARPRRVRAIRLGLPRFSGC